jgi:hypothetical protein
MLLLRYFKKPHKKYFVAKKNIRNLQHIPDFYFRKYPGIHGVVYFICNLQQVCKEYMIKGTVSREKRTNKGTASLEKNSFNKFYSYP